MLSLCTPARAEIEDIVVTAQKREQSLEDVPIAISALGEETLRNRDIRDFDSYLRSIPSASFADQGNQGNEVKIRGVGNGTSRLSPTVAVYLGEVPVIHNGRSINSSFDFYITDMARIEVLRGPQGQIYGSNSLGGAIKNVPNKPDLSGFGVSGSASAATIEDGAENYSGELTLNLPLNDVMGLRFTGYAATRGGWIDNVFEGGVRIGDGSQPTDLNFGFPGPPYPPVVSAPLLPANFLPLVVGNVQSLNPADYQQVINYTSPSNARDDVNETDRAGVRGLFTWQATDSFTLDLMLAYEDQETDGTSWVTDVPAMFAGPYPFNGRGPQTYAVPKRRDLPLSEQAAWNPRLYPTSAKDYQQDNSSDAGNTDEIFLANLVLNWDFGFATLTSSTSYWDREEVLETPLPLGYVVTGVDGTWSVFNQRVDEPTAFIQEVRLTSSDTGPLTWLVGAFYQDISQDFIIDIVDVTGFMMLNLFPPNFSNLVPPPWPAFPEGAQFTNPTYVVGTNFGDYDDEQIALFGELAYDLTDQWNLAFSFRWYDLEQSANVSYSGFFNANLLDTVTDTETSESDILPKLTLSWTPTDDYLIYATAAEGWRSGVVNEKVPPGICAGPEKVPDQTEPDSVWNYELGAKLSFADRRISVSGAVYRIDWKDLQSQVILQNTSLGGTLCTYDRLFNVGDATIMGAELEAAFQITDRLRLDTAFSYNDGEYDGNAGSPETQELLQELNISDGTTIEGTAEVTAYVALQYDLDLLQRPGFVRADYTYTGDIAPKPTDFNLQQLAYPIGDFQIVNLRGGLSLTDQIRAELFVNNLFDEFAVTRAIDLGGIAPPTYFTTPPRTIGATLRFDF